MRNLSLRQNFLNHPATRIGCTWTALVMVLPQPQAFPSSRSVDAKSKQEPIVLERFTRLKLDPHGGDAGDKVDGGVTGKVTG